MAFGSTQALRGRVYVLLDGTNTEDRLSLGTNLFIWA